MHLQEKYKHPYTAVLNLFAKHKDTKPRTQLREQPNRNRIILVMLSP